MFANARNVVRNVFRIAGTFLVFYIAAKVIEIGPDSAMGFGVALILIGSVFGGAWYFMTTHEAWVKTYLTMTLPS